MEYGKDFVSALMNKSERAISLNRDSMYKETGFFVTQLLLLLNTCFVMTFDRIKKDNASFTNEANGRLDRDFYCNSDKEYFGAFVANSEWSHYQFYGENLGELNINGFAKEISEKRLDPKPRKDIEYIQLFSILRNALAHGQAYPMSSSEAVIFPEKLKPKIQPVRDAGVIDRIYFISKWLENDKDRNVKGVNLIVCTNQALFDFWNGWKALIKQDFKEEALGEQTILSSLPRESTIHAESEKVIGYGD